MISCYANGKYNFEKTKTMIKIFKNKSIDWISLCLWTLFSIAVARGLSLININFILYYLIIPGFLFFTYLLYYFLKTTTLLKFKHFIFSVLFISIGFYVFEFLVKTYVRLNYNEGDLMRLIVFFLVNITLAFLLYFLIYIFQKVYKSWVGQ
jgi:hypothetical protein